MFALLEESVGKELLDIGNNFLAVTPKTQAAKAKMTCGTPSN